MSERSDIEIIFSKADGAVRAREIAKIMIHGFILNGYEYLPFDDMRKVNADGWVHYPERYVRYEEQGSFRQLLFHYQMLYRRSRREKVSFTREQEEVKKHFGCVSTDGCRLIIAERSGVGDDRQIEHQYFQDFFSMLCFLVAVKSPDFTFEGLYRSFEPESYAKRILTHAVYDGDALTFEQMEGDPVYATELISWEREEDRFMKCGRRFPFIRVDILTGDRDEVKQDKELSQWLQEVNSRSGIFSAPDGAGQDYPARKPVFSSQAKAGAKGAQIEMVCANLYFLHGCDPHVMIHASSRQLCVRYRDELVRLLSGKGYRTNLFSILYKDECRGEHIRIPDSVTKIGDNSFRNRRSLKNIEIPENVTEIGTDAFRECLSLSEITIPDSVRSIESFAFFLCFNLKRIILPEKLNRLDCGLFCGCRSLEEIVIPESVTEIEEYVFSGCTALTSVVLPKRLRTIKKEAFKGCSSLKQIVIPETVAQIGEGLFKDCSPDLVIYGKKGSEADRWAAENGISFARI